MDNLENLKELFIQNFNMEMVARDLIDMVAPKKLEKYIYEKFKKEFNVEELEELFRSFMDKKEIEETFKKMGVGKDIFIVEYETLKNETKKIAVKSYTKKMAIEKFEDYCMENGINNIVDCWIKED